MKTEMHVCDRCKKPFEYRLSRIAGYFANGIKRKNEFKYTVLNYGNPNGYMYSDYRVELCADCTKALLDFLYAGKGVNNE